MDRTKLVARECYRSQRDRFQNSARFDAAKKKEERKNKKNGKIVRKMIGMGILSFHH